jgi:large subunit ribosomal protein L33
MAKKSNEKAGQRDPRVPERAKRRNYITSKNKQNDRERIEINKYCRWDRQHTVHKETR